MTCNFTRPALALALALTLAACGGKATFPVSGTIEGLQYGGLVLSTNGMDLPIAANATSFTFPNTLSYGEVYNVTMKASPAHQTCLVGSFTSRITGVTYNGATDTAGRFGAINIGVGCTTNQVALGGKITGLTSAGLQLNNGSVPFIAPLAADASFTFPTVEFGKSYSITVLAQPLNETCSVSSNGTGVMGDLAPAGIEVTCVKKT
ncbi:hypothetical protein [Massilia psychrophila]|uniref:Lipoprotein n=1 Tax=Massilia psychrophila TaxID=1603353 RepID=A0A2G8T675_9BURK|nr:hypothetical protein [Massilia psychrophila]PIL41555.1 hypothetical protein CR103_00395 [Massilia psychrophila]GGE62316.1 hypothetical protein GCM10008020_03060 [Massilia psychrophila]